MFKPCCMVAVVCVTLCGTALAADITWTGLRDGTSFGNSGNWSPMNVPGQSDTAIFNISFPLVTLGSSVENERLSVLPFGDGTLSLTGNSYSLLGFGPESIEVEGSVTISDGQLFSTKGALIHPSGSMTLTDLQWDHSGGLDIQGSLTLSPVFNFTSVTSSQGFLAPGSTVTILNASSWEIAEFLDIDGSLSVSFTSSVVSGGADIGAGGSVTMTDANWINNSFLGIDGSLALSTKSALTSSDAQIGADGSVMIDTSSILSVGGFLTMIGGGNASLSISNFSTVTATSFDAGTEIAGLISLTIDSGGSLILSEPIQSLNIAQHPDSNATVIVDDGILFNTGPMTIGEAGTGSLNILNHGNVFCSEARIANTLGAVGTVTVTGTAAQNTHTSWEITGNLQVGDGGTGSLLIENGAFVDCGAGRIGQESGLSGTVTVTGFDSEWNIASDLDIGPGDLTISAGGFVFSSDGFIGGGDAGCVTVTGAASQWINTGLFIIGVGSTGSLDVTLGGMMVSGPSFLGLFAGSSGTVTVAGPGSTWINLSDLYVGDFGSGTLNITNGGSVSNTAGFVGSFAGSNGTALVDGLGSTWTNLVSLAVGNFGAGSLTVSNGGAVAAPQITISDTGEVHGDGILAGNVTNSGLASPGLSIGTLNIQGDYLQTPNGVLDIELSASGGDRLAITGQAELSFPTLMLSVVSGDEPSVGQMFTILTAAMIKGQDFTVIDDGGQYTVTYSPTDIVVTVVALPPPPPSTADITGPLAVPDGCVDAFDLGTLLGAWCSAASDPDPPGDVDPPCEGCTSPNFVLANISGPANVPDGCVDAFDLAKLLAEWYSFAGGNPCGTCF